MKFLVTGPTGPVGQYVVEELMTHEDEVRVFALPAVMHRIPYRNRVEIVPGRMQDASSLRRALENVEVVFHTAQIMPPPYRDPDEMREVNTEGTRRLIQLCPESVRRIVFFSTVTVYTPHLTPDTWPVVDDAPRLAHGNAQLSAYGQSMIEAEDVLKALATESGLEYCILRPTIVAGRSARFLEQMVISLLRQPESAPGLNKMWGTMQWVHGSDMGKIGISAGTHPAAANEEFIIAGPESITAYDVLEVLWDIINPAEDFNPYSEAARAESAGIPKFDFSKIGTALDFKPTVGIRQCLEQVLARIDFYTSMGMQMPESPRNRGVMSMGGF